MSARILQFPNKANPSPDDIVVLMRAAIKQAYRKVTIVMNGTR
jgi:hypothetical protein